MDTLISQKIIKHMEGLGEYDANGADETVKELSARHGVPEEAVRMAIAEWEAGKGRPEEKVPSEHKEDIAEKFER